jgi:hypothetical protein
VAALPLCLLTPDMHNRTVIDEAFAAVQREVQPAMETNSVLSLVMAVAESIPGMEVPWSPCCQAPWWPRCATCRA